MNCPELSVIVCTYNRGAGLRGLLEGFKAKSDKLDASAWELLVVDNGSTDNTAEIVDGFVKEKALPIRYLCEPTPGKSHALNSGVMEARSDFFVFVDDDVILDDGWYPAILNALERDDYAMFGGRVLPIISTPLPAYLLDRNGLPIPYNGPIVRHDYGDVERVYTESMARPIGANMFVRRAAFERYGLFRTDLGPLKENGVGNEDTEVGFRLTAAGEKLLYLPRALVYHPIPAHRLTKAFFQRYYFWCGRGHARYDYPPPNSIRYFNIPRYEFRHAFAALLKFALSDAFLPPGERFRSKLGLLNLFGIMAEHYRDEGRGASVPPQLVPRAALSAEDSGTNERLEH